MSRTEEHKVSIHDRTDPRKKIAVNTDGEIVVRDHFMEVGAGNLPGHASYGFFGRNPDIDIVDGFETVWNGGGIYTGQNCIAAERVELFSTDPADAAAGTGLRTISLFGLDINLNQIYEVVTLNGVTPVLSTQSFYRCSYAEGASAGSGGANVGTIIGRQSTTVANVFFNMPIGMNHTAVLAYTVPAGKTGLVVSWGLHIISKTAAAAEGRYLIRYPGGIWMCEDIGTARDTAIWHSEFPYFHHHQLPEGTDIRIDADTSANNTAIGASLDILIIPATGE